MLLTYQPKYGGHVMDRAVTHTMNIIKKAKRFVRLFLEYVNGWVTAKYLEIKKGNNTYKYYNNMVIKRSLIIIVCQVIHNNRYKVTKYATIFNFNSNSLPKNL